VERALRSVSRQSRTNKEAHDMTQLAQNRSNGRAVWPMPAGFDRLFDEFTRGLGAPAAGAEFAPTLDVSETPTEWRVRAELPGVAPEAVQISVTGNVLSLAGEKKSEADETGENWRRSERRYGRFARTLEFPSDVDASRVEARAKNGVLTIVLPKAEASRPKTITVKAE
jgi:HSP20 family protein